MSLILILKLLSLINNSIVLMIKTSQTTSQRYIKKDGTIIKYSTTRSCSKEEIQITAEMRWQIINDYQFGLSFAKISQRHGTSVTRAKTVVSDYYKQKSL